MEQIDGRPERNTPYRPTENSERGGVEQHLMLIDGVRTGAAAAEWIRVTDPGNGRVFAQVPQATPEQVDRAVATARGAFERGAWRGLDKAKRTKILWRIGDLVDLYAAELADLESKNQGGPVRVATTSIVPSVAHVFRYYAGAIDRLDGRANEVTAGGHNLHAYTRREPIGVVGIIVPWNAPLTITAWKLAPALAAGCACIIKPAEETPLTALRLAEICLEAGVPAGVVHVLTGTGSTTGAALAAHGDIDKISFTGSTEVGRSILAAAAGNLKKLTLELGGKSPVVVFEDADIEAVVPGVAAGIFRNAGQVCTAGSRLLIQERLHDQVVDEISQLASRLRIGYRTDPDAELGPLISAPHRQRVADYVQSGREQGADVVTGGASVPGDGFFFQPTVLANANPDMRVVQEEIFGPVLAVLPFADEEEAVATANASVYGLAASVWTGDISRAHRVAARLRAGRVGINVHAQPEVTMPTGGYKQSGWGRELGPEGLEPYLETKTIMTML